jgi:hypothetical protein
MRATQSLGTEHTTYQRCLLLSHLGGSVRGLPYLGTTNGMHCAQLDYYNAKRASIRVPKLVASRLESALHIYTYTLASMHLLLGIRCPSLV